MQHRCPCLLRIKVDDLRYALLAGSNVGSVQGGLSSAMGGCAAAWRQRRHHMGKDGLTGQLVVCMFRSTEAIDRSEFGLSSI